MTAATMRASEMEEVESVARELLPRRADRIVDGKIDGVHWFIALINEAKGIARRRRIHRRKAA